MFPSRDPHPKFHFRDTHTHTRHDFVFSEFFTEVTLHSVACSELINLVTFYFVYMKSATLAGDEGTTCCHGCVPGKAPLHKHQHPSQFPGVSGK